jgi:hypothetical protein
VCPGVCTAWISIPPSWNVSPSFRNWTSYWPPAGPVAGPLGTTLVRQVGPRPEPLGELTGARQEVGVDVRLGHGHDAQPLRLRRLHVAVDVPLGVDDQGLAGLLAAHQVRVLGELRVENWRNSMVSSLLCLVVRFVLGSIRRASTAPGDAPSVSAAAACASPRTPTSPAGRDQRHHQHRSPPPPAARTSARDTPPAAPSPCRTGCRRSSSGPRGSGCPPTPSATAGSARRGSVRSPSRLINQTDSAATATAVPMIPYMWKLWNRNISWIRNQDTTSLWTKTTPRYTPTSR